MQGNSLFLKRSLASLARIFYLGMSLLLKIAFKEHKIKERLNFSRARSHILFYIKFMRHVFETSHYMY